MDKPFKVLKIDEMSRVGEMGGIEKFYRHTIRTKGGTILKVDVSAEDFTPEKAEPILRARADEADKILKL